MTQTKQGRDSDELLLAGTQTPSLSTGTLAEEIAIIAFARTAELQ